MKVEEIQHQKLKLWIEQAAAHLKPKEIYICDGSEQEYDAMAQKLVDSGAFVKLKKRPNSYWCSSDPRDVARVEERTFICSESPDDAGPTNHHKNPKVMMDELMSLFEGCMEGRTMYVVPFCMGPLDADLAMVGVEITDSPYVVCNMRIMTRMGAQVLEKLGTDGEFIPCWHSVGVPLKEGVQDVSWPCDPENTVIAHFPEKQSIYSYGSGYGGNALLGKKCLALRIASVKARDEKWLAEHMLIIKVTNPEGESKYICGSFPSACGKTNLAMLEPTIPGWKVECVGDDIAWMKVGDDGRLYAINPESGFFGVAPGTSMTSNPHCMTAIEKNTIFTNVALTKDGDVWWEGMSETPPEIEKDWKGNPWSPESGEKAAHPNSRFTAPATQCPIMANEFSKPEGVPIDAIIFGGRRKSVVPLVFETLSWEHGVYAGASLSSEMTAAAKGSVGKLRHDPFSMLPFCGYHMGDYFQHWIDFSDYASNLPKIYTVNWFRQDENGKFMWPGFGENSRVLKWVFERCQGKADAKETPVGHVPTDLDTSNLNLSNEVLEQLFAIDSRAWIHELEEVEDYFTLFEEKLPQALTDQLNAIRSRL